MMFLRNPSRLSKLRFNAVGNLPAPAGHPAPQIFLCPYHLLYATSRKGAVAFRDESDDTKDTSYTFTPMKPRYWHSWTAYGWEDCEVGHGWIRAWTPKGVLFRWEVDFYHDGTPELEFWGAVFGEPCHIWTSSAYSNALTSSR